MKKQQILAALAARDIDQLLGTGVTASDLTRAEVTVSQLVRAGFEVSQLIRAGYTASQIIGAGFKARKLIRAGFTASQLIRAGFAASKLVRAGVTASQLIRAGCTVPQLVGAGFAESQLIEPGFRTSELTRAGVTVSQLTESGFTASELTHAGVATDVPTVEKPYSRMLAAIESSDIIHDQSDYGPYGTPMCTASHLVALAGEAGAKLLEVCDGNFRLAAGLIHARSRPDAPCQDFGLIPQEWALAYIRERASEE